MPAIVGKNVSIYNITGTSTYNFLGIWKDITLRFTVNFANNTTPADSREVVRVQTTWEWDFTAQNLIYPVYGSIGFGLIQQGNAIQLNFNDDSNSVPVVAFGAFKEVSPHMQEEGWEETIQGHSIGPFNGNPSILINGLYPSF